MSGGKKAGAKKAGKGGKKAGKKGGPKRAKSAYILFCSDKRAEVKKDDPELSFGDVARKLSEMWKNADKDTKKVLCKTPAFSLLQRFFRLPVSFLCLAVQHYESLAAKDKARYQKEMNNAPAAAADNDDGGDDDGGDDDQEEDGGDDE